MDLRGPFRGREGKGKDGEREGKVVEGYRRVERREREATGGKGTGNGRDGRGHGMGQGGKGKGGEGYSPQSSMPGAANGN